jgi:hypothetical protein
LPPCRTGLRCMLAHRKEAPAPRRARGYASGLLLSEVYEGANTTAPRSSKCVKLRTK